MLSTILLTSCSDFFASLLFHGAHFDEFIEGTFESDDKCVLAHAFTIENEDGTSIYYDDLIITKTKMILKK